MHCTNCDYPLWRIQARQCPECGQPFRPSDFDFMINSVRFGCPHCDQSYYGIGARGHLVPSEFACVSCGRQVAMDEMVLRPAEGVPDQQTRPDTNPWLRRREVGLIRAWFGTVGRALVGQVRLMRGTPLQEGAGQAWGFALVTVFVTWVAAILPWSCLFMVPLLGGMGPGGPGPATFASGVGLGLGVALLVLIALHVVGLMLCGLAAHGLLRGTGTTVGGLGRTMQAMCYSSGANTITAVPFIGPYVGWIWWLVSAVIMLKEGQQVHGGRAAFAVLTLPITVIAIVIGLYVWVIVSLMTGAIGPATMVGPSKETQVVAQAVISYAGTHGGQGPAHAALLVSSGDLGTAGLVALDTITRDDDVPVAGTTLDQLAFLPPNRMELTAQAAADALPPGVIAHRVGDFVFTHHGIDFTRADPGLWIVVLSPDPDLNPGPAGLIVAFADGRTRRVTPVRQQRALDDQNALRQGLGLPPLPPPSTVTHDAPAVAGP